MRRGPAREVPRHVASEAPAGPSGGQKAAELAETVVESGCAGAVP
jgi:hypothetical protein